MRSSSLANWILIMARLHQTVHAIHERVKHCCVAKRCTSLVADVGTVSGSPLPASGRGAGGEGFSPSEPPHPNSLPRSGREGEEKIANNEASRRYDLLTPT